MEGSISNRSGCEYVYDRLRARARGQAFGSEMLRMSQAERTRIESQIGAARKDVAKEEDKTATAAKVTRQVETVGP